MNTEDLKLLAKNLANPQGEKGIEIAEMMDATNISMTMESVAALELDDSNRILEIGHGNAGHLEQLLKLADDLNYTGLDISETMRDHAQRKNIKFENQSQFFVYDGQNIPFGEQSFDKIFTVNTLYFWKEPNAFLEEIYRVLRNNGTFVLTFGNKDFMSNLPFTQYGFQLYDTEDVEKLIAKSQFVQVKLLQKEEWIPGKTGDGPVKRNYTILTLKK
ncbi:class I SAM-dependent methyltransferase [Elizabethkingia anophelis]|nr:class I SAM-dependent methyltransferase [Elizabethkingia anophelis]